MNGNFASLTHDPTQPYNQAIQTGLHSALPSYTNIGWEPRLGFAWTPRGSGTSTVVRGGIGIFHDFFPGTVADSFLNNPPLYNQFFVGPGAVTPGVSGSILDQAAAANTAFTSGFANGGTFNSISQASPFFVPPSLFNATHNIHAPQYQEWNLEVQQGIGEKTSVSINYVGNHQIYGPIQNGGPNAYCNVLPIIPPNPSVAPATPCASQLLNTIGFVGLPLTPPDPRFGTVTEISSSNVGNYNGVTLSLQRRFSSLQLHIQPRFDNDLKWRILAIQFQHQ